MLAPDRRRAREIGDRAGEAQQPDLGATAEAPVLGRALHEVAGLGGDAEVLDARRARGGR